MVVIRIHSANGVTIQICRSISMIQSEIILENHIKGKENSAIIDFVEYLNHKATKKTSKLTNARYFGRDYNTAERWTNELELSQRSRTYHRMVKNRCLYTSCKKTNLRSNNSFAITIGGIYIKIAGFIVDNDTNQEFTLYYRIDIDNIFNRENLPNKKIVTISRDLSVIGTNEIHRICVVVDIDDDSYICPVPNSYCY